MNQYNVFNNVGFQEIAGVAVGSIRKYFLESRIGSRCLRVVTR